MLVFNSISSCHDKSARCYLISFFPMLGAIGGSASFLEVWLHLSMQVSNSLVEYPLCLCETADEMPGSLKRLKTSPLSR